MAYHVEAAEYVDARGRPTSRLDYDQFARLAGGKVLSLLRPDAERAERLARGRSGGVLERVGDELSAHVITDGPADDEVDNASQMWM